MVSGGSLFHSGVVLGKKKNYLLNLQNTNSQILSRLRLLETTGSVPFRCMQVY